MATGESNEAIIVAVLETLGSKVGKLKRGYVEAACPLAHWRHEKGIDNNPSFGVVYDPTAAKKSAGYSHCFSCGYSGDIREVASLMHAWGAIPRADLGSIMKMMEQVTEGNLPLSLSAHHDDDPFPPVEWLESFPRVSKATPDAVAYLDARGVSGEVVQHFALRFDPQRFRIAVPLHDRAQRFRGLIGRTLIKDPTGPRYFCYPFKTQAPRGFTWFNEHALDLSKPVVVVEGVFDAFKVWPVYRNVTAALSISFRTPGLGWHHQVSRWITMFDTGKGGALARVRLQDRIMAPGSRVWHLEPPPGRKDPGESTPDEIKAALDALSVGKPLRGL